MKQQDKATELIEKFGRSSINQVEYTIDIWKYKRKLRTNEMIEFYMINDNKYNTAKIGYIITKRTLKYWNDVIKILKQHYERM